MLDVCNIQNDKNKIKNSICILYFCRNSIILTSFSPPPLDDAVKWRDLSCRSPISHKTARFTNPVPLSTILQNGRCYSELLCCESGLNLPSSLLDYTASRYRMALYSMSILHGLTEAVIFVVFTHLIVGEPVNVCLPVSSASFRRLA